MIITFFNKLKIKYFFWKLGIKTKKYKKLIETTKFLDTHQPRSSFNLKV